jgi:hypothetical protein
LIGIYPSAQRHLRFLLKTTAFKQRFLFQTLILGLTAEICEPSREKKGTADAVPTRHELQGLEEQQLSKSLSHVIGPLRLQEIERHIGLITAKNTQFKNGNTYLPFEFILRLKRIVAGRRYAVGKILLHAWQQTICDLYEEMLLSIRFSGESVLATATHAGYRPCRIARYV